MADILTRYSSIPFPAYRYIPGQSPHPTRDPEGHSHGKGHEAPPQFDAHNWRDCEIYLYGIDLYNHGYWWEAHEALEACWVAAGRTTTEGLFLQGLIQISVACLKQHQGFHEVAKRMGQEGLEKFPRGTMLYFGVPMEPLRRDLPRFLSGEIGTPPRIRLEIPDE